MNLIILEFLILDFNTWKLWFHCINFPNLPLVNKYLYLCRCINIVVQFLLIPGEFNFLAFPYVNLLEFSRVGIVKIEMKQKSNKLKRILKMQIYTMAFYREDKIIISSYSKLQNVKNKIKLTSIFVYSFSRIQEIPLHCTLYVTQQTP